VERGDKLNDLVGWANVLEGQEMEGDSDESLEPGAELSKGKGSSYE